MAKKPFTNKTNRPSGSSLLIAIMVMGILMTLSLGVSNLMIGTLRESRLFIEKTKAWYAAESGVEQALNQIDAHGPGFNFEQKIEENPFHYEYVIRAAAAKIPYREEFEIGGNINGPETYTSLDFNDVVTIPLFRSLPDGSTDDVQSFRVDFYLDSKLLDSPWGAIFRKVDILRWKLFGIAKNGKNIGKMESMNDYYPLYEDRYTVNNPTCVGADTACLNWNGGKFFQWAGDEYNEVRDFRISDFLREHIQNILVLGNNVNMDLIPDGSLYVSEKKVLSKIYYRVVAEDTDAQGNAKENLTLPMIKIISDGFSGDSKQSLNVNVQRESFLPVFNYSLYRTAQ